MALRVVLSGLNVPVPLLDQVPPVALVTLPFKDTIGLFAQTDMFTPALAIGFGLIVTALVTVPVHPRLEVAVKVTV